MKSIVKKITGKFICCTTINVGLAEDEVFVNAVPQLGQLKPIYNFETDEFYESATDEELQNLRTEKIKDAYEQRKLDGWNAYQDFRAEMVKEIYDQVLTKQQAFIIEDFLGKGYDKIAQQGDWETAYYKLSTTIIPEQYAFVNSYLEKAKAVMLTYIQENYKQM